MTNITETAVDNDTVFLGNKIETDETVTGTVSGTAGSITDSTSYPVADQDTKTLSFTIDGGTAQLVTFDITVTTALLVAQQLNDQLTGCSAGVVSGKVVVTSDTVGSLSSVAVTAGTSALTWATAVAGTGSGAAGLTITKGTLMARNTSTGKMVPYVSGGSNGTGTPTGVIDTTNVFAATGDKQLKIGRSGSVNAALLLVNGTGAAASSLEIDSLEKNSSIVAIKVVNTGR